MGPLAARSTQFRFVQLWPYHIVQTRDLIILTNQGCGEAKFRVGVDRRDYSSELGSEYEASPIKENLSPLPGHQKAH